LARGSALLLPAVLLALVGGASGCGGEAGVSSGATVNVYVGASLCPAAQRDLKRRRGRAGDVRVRALCLAESRGGRRLDLAAVGADARRATEDSTAIAYVEAAGPANRFSRPIVEEAGIAWFKASSGAAAMASLLDAVEAAGSGSLRESVREGLNGK
jgi:hypothetical protein